MISFIKKIHISILEAFQSKRFFILFSLAMLAAKIWLVNAHLVMATISPHDDLLFISQAYNLLNGQWLGEYNQMTLIKGPFYPLFIALSYYLDIPLLVAQQLVYAFASFVTIWAVYPLIKQKWVLFLLFIFLLLNPFSYNYPAVGRLFREGLYASLGLLVLSCVLGLYIRSRQSWGKVIIWSIGTGIFLAAFWNTREESIWLVPSLVLILSLALFNLRKLPLSRTVFLIGLYILPVAILLGTNYTLKKINQKHYGVFATIELETPEFESAYGGLLAIKSDKWRRFFPAVREVRESVYAVSPAFREVQPFLDGPLGLKWQEQAYATDIPAAFFIWTFRDSVAAAGYYKNGPQTLQFYQRIGNEINQACIEGKLDCKPGATSLIPAWHREYNKLLLPTFYSVMEQMLSFRNFSASIEGKNSTGSAATMIMYETVTREKVLSSRPYARKEIPEFHRHLDKEKTKILNDIGSGYQLIIVPLFLLSFVIFLFTVGKSIIKREVHLFTVVSSAALAGTLSLAFILTLLTITSYSEIARALTSAYPMVLLFISAVILDVLNRISPLPTIQE